MRIPMMANNKTATLILHARKPVMMVVKSKGYDQPGVGLNGVEFAGLDEQDDNRVSGRTLRAISLVTTVLLGAGAISVLGIVILIIADNFLGIGAGG